METWWNHHHLALFYFVARHGGISAAVRHIPYSIQQPALSGQMRELERSLGCTLFTRHPQPFALTAEGARIYNRFAAYYDTVMRELDEVARGPCVRLGAPHFIVTRYLPAILATLRRREPALRVDCVTLPNPQLVEALTNGQLDLALMVTDAPPPGLRCQRLLRLPLALYLPKNQVLPRAGLPVDQPLVCPLGNAGVCRQFDAGLKASGLTWRPQCTVDSVSVVPTYVAAGHGVGLGLAFAPLVPDKAVRMHPLRRFEPVHLLALCARESGPAVTRVLDEIQRHAGER
jgi:DNA-binding transcriptional LysR family regulator